MIKRSSGILMPISSLPSAYGIGTLGKAAYDFADFLAEAGQSWWQVLPVGPTSMGDSPYQSFSSSAGNPYFIDLDMLCQDGLLEKSELDAINWGDDTGNVDYGKIYENRFAVLQKAAERGWERDKEAVAAFAEENGGWLPDYALFMACKRNFGMRCWTEWPDEALRCHEAEAVAKYSVMLEQDIRLFTYIQFLFYRQWKALRAYLKEKGIGIIGDMPIYVALDSADVWASPLSFLLDEKNIPIEVAGVPPDYFSEDGQLWGNPLYRWEDMAGDGYAWWLRRIEGAVKLYDILRIDHFRGFEAYWAVPYGETTAKNGKWVKGPGMDFIGVLKQRYPDMKFIAEDLGFLTDGVRELLRDSGFPGMKVLEFAFDPNEPSDYLPYKYEHNCICYAGTHDNATLKSWQAESDKKCVAFAREYLGAGEDEDLNWAILRGGMASVADLFVAQMQDYLGLDDAARMNTPGLPSGNWRWRVDAAALDSELAKKIGRMTRVYGRCGKEIKSVE